MSDANRQSPGRSPDLIRKQLAEVAALKKESEAYGARDFASQCALQSLVRHEHELQVELRAAELQAASATAAQKSVIALPSVVVEHWIEQGQSWVRSRANPVVLAIQRLVSDQPALALESASADLGEGKTLGGVLLLDALDSPEIGSPALRLELTLFAKGADAFSFQAVLLEGERPVARRGQLLTLHQADQSSPMQMQLSFGGTFEPLDEFREQFHSGLPRRTYSLSLRAGASELRFGEIDFSELMRLIEQL